MDIMKYEILIDKRKIIVPVQIKGISENLDFNFILDTGASKSVIDESVANWLGYNIRKLETGDRLTTIGGGINSKTLELPKLTLFGKEMINFEVNILKLPMQVLYFADGLIGMDFLLQFKNLQFNFEEKTIEI
jgi:predicted aspartyl protease